MNRLNKTTDAVVIGAGVIGCSVAYYLAKSGVKVTVIEKGERLFCGTSGANQGGCPLQLVESPIFDFYKESLRLFRSLSNDLGYDIEYRNVKFLMCCVDERYYHIVEKHAQNMINKGIKVQLLDGNRIRELEPSLSQDIIAGTEEGEEYSGLVNPFKLNYGFAQAAQKLGTEFLFDRELKEIETTQSRITHIVTDKERIATHFVINAAGAWSAEIGKTLGLIIPIRAQRGQLLVTEPVELNKRWRYISGIDYLITAFGEDSGDVSRDPGMRLGVAASYVQEDTGNWTIGSSRDFVANYDKGITLQTIKYMAETAIKFMPNLKDANCVRMFAGLRPYCYVDGLPILGKVDKLSGFIMATGHAGEGVVLAPITGKLISELIVENKTTMPLDPFAFSRFENM